MAKPRTIDLHSLTLPAEVEELADIPTFSGSDRLAQAGRIAMAKHVRKLYAHLPGVLSGDDPHDIHQMRVATRRLRASLASTAPAYRAGLVSQLYRRLRKLARALGEVRDRDVLLLRLRHSAAEHGADEPTELHAAIKRLEAERDEAHAALLHELQRKRTRRLLHDLNAFLSQPLQAVQADDQGLPLLVHHHAGSAIWQHYEAVRRFETAIPHASSERLHQLRIACKHLRYTLELFEPALGNNARALIKQVTTMQEHLGDLHDADVALAYFGEQPPTEAATSIQPDQTPAPPDDQTPAPPQSHNSGTIDVVTAALADAHNLDDPTTSQSNGVPAAAVLNATGIDVHLAARSAERQRLLEGVAPLWSQLNGEGSRRKLAKLLAAL